MGNFWYQIQAPTLSKSSTGHCPSGIAILELPLAAWRSAAMPWLFFPFFMQLLQLITFLAVNIGFCSRILYVLVSKQVGSIWRRFSKFPFKIESADKAVGLKGTTCQVIVLFKKGNNVFPFKLVSGCAIKKDRKPLK